MAAMKIVSLLLIISVTSTVSRDIRAAPPTCYFCSNIADAVDCETSIECNSGEKCVEQDNMEDDVLSWQQCFTDKFLNDEGHVKFNLGCKSQHICDLIAQVGRREVVEEADKRSAIHLCTECCKGGYCNNAVCTGLTTPRPSIQCYNCPDVEAPHACERLKTCENFEECYADIWYNDRGDQRHSLGCRSRGQCSLYLHNATGALHGRDITHGDIQLCGGCCDSNYCNLDGCYKIPHHILHGNGK